MPFFGLARKQLYWPGYLKKYLKADQHRFKIYQEIHHIFGSIFDPFWDPFGCHVGSIFAPFLVSDRSWTLIFIKNVDFHENL